MHAGARTYYLYRAIHIFPHLRTGTALAPIDGPRYGPAMAPTALVHAKTDPRQVAAMGVVLVSVLSFLLVALALLHPLMGAVAALFALILIVAALKRKGS